MIGGFELYTCSSDIIVDKVFFYEQLNEAMDEIRVQINLNETPSLPRAKGNYRKDKSTYRDVLSEKDKKKIAEVYAREIAFFNYEW